MPLREILPTHHGRFGRLILLALLAVGLGTPSRADQAISLVELFSRTCAHKPALPSALHQRAILAGFMPQGGPVTPEMERGPTFNFLYSAVFARVDTRVRLSALFEETDQGINVVCAVSSENVTSAGLRSELESNMRLGEPAKLLNGTDRMTAEWLSSTFRLEAAVHKDPPYRGRVEAHYRRPRT